MHTINSDLGNEKLSFVLQVCKSFGLNYAYSCGKHDTAKCENDQKGIYIKYTDQDR